MNIHVGTMHAASMQADAKHVGFVLRRYHFVARMLRGQRDVLEIGCGDCTGAPIVKQAVSHLEGCDVVDYGTRGVMLVHDHDMLSGPLLNDGKPWSAIYALDVLEHIPREVENLFFRHVNESLAEHGSVIIGSPSLESQRYASRLSRQHHVNCKTGEHFNATLRRHYHNVFLLGLNDYALHDGFDAMVHYRLALCSGKKLG